MPFTGKAGDTLYLNDAGGGHLYVILTNPNQENEVVLCCFTASRYWKENVVVFSKKRNKKLFRKNTTVNYKDAIIADVQKLLGKVAKNPRLKGEYCPQDILNDVVQGAFDSQQISPTVIEELKKHYHRN